MCLINYSFWTVYQKVKYNVNSFIPKTEKRYTISNSHTVWNYFIQGKYTLSHTNIHFHIGAFTFCQSKKKNELMKKYKIYLKKKYSQESGSCWHTFLCGVRYWQLFNHDHRSDSEWQKTTGNYTIYPAHCYIYLHITGDGGCSVDAQILLFTEGGHPDITKYPLMTLSFNLLFYFLISDL